MVFLKNRKTLLTFFERPLLASHCHGPYNSCGPGNHLENKKGNNQMPCLQPWKTWLKKCGEAGTGSLLFITQVLPRHAAQDHSLEGMLYTRNGFKHLNRGTQGPSQTIPNLLCYLHFLLLSISYTLCPEQLLYQTCTESHAISNPSSFSPGNFYSFFETQLKLQTPVNPYLNTLISYFLLNASTLLWPYFNYGI